MKIQVNGQDFFEITDIQKQVICNDVHTDEFESDMKRRLEYILTHKYEQCYKRLKQEWDEKLKGRLHAVPTDPDAYAEVIFAQPDYLCRKGRCEKELADKAALKKAFEYAEAVKIEVING